jgi:hypothetical protein
LTDEFVELSLVVEQTLDILYNHEIASFNDADLFHHVIEFARKRDMPIILKTISSQLIVHTNTPSLSNPVNSRYRIAIDLGDPELIIAVMRSKVGRVLDEPAPLDAFTPLFPTKPLSLGESTLTAEDKQYLKEAGVFKLGSWPC